MKYRMNVKKWLAVAGAVTASAALIYFLDPKRGAYRRAIVAHQFRNAGKQANRQWNRFAHDASKTAEQTLAQRPWRGWGRNDGGIEHVSDRSLERQVRAELQQLGSHAEDIDVKVDDGRIYLRGWATPRAVRKLMRRTRSLGGVATIENQVALR